MNRYERADFRYFNGQDMTKQQIKDKLINLFLTVDGDIDKGEGERNKAEEEGDDLSLSYFVGFCKALREVKWFLEEEFHIYEK